MSACEALVNSDTRTTTTIIIGTTPHSLSMVMAVINPIRTHRHLAHYPLDCAIVSISGSSSSPAPPVDQSTRGKSPKHALKRSERTTEVRKSRVVHPYQVSNRRRKDVLYFINDFLLNIELRQYVVFEYEGGCSNSRRSMRVSFRLL